MSSAVDPIGGHEAVEIAEAASYYVRRNIEAQALLSDSHTFPSIEDAAGTPRMHYESMVIQCVQTTEPDTRDRHVRLYPALPINGAKEAEEMAPILVTLMGDTEVRCGFIALLQRRNDSREVGTVYFFSDDRSATHKLMR